MIRKINKKADFGIVTFVKLVLTLTVIIVIVWIIRKIISGIL